MTDNLQLQTTRLTNASAGNLVDDAVADIEHAIATVFGITQDSPVSQVMSISTAGNVTMIGDLILSGAPTANLHCATKKYADDNLSGAAGDPQIVLVQENSNGAVEHGSADNIVFGSTPTVEITETDQYDYATSSSKLVCQSAGDYLIFAYLRLRCDNDDAIYETMPFDFKVDLKINGATVISEAFAGRINTITTNGLGRGTFSIVRTLAESDYVQLYLTSICGAGKYTIYYYPAFGWVKLG